MELQGAALYAPWLLWLPLLAAVICAFLSRPVPLISALLSWLSTSSCLAVAVGIFQQRWNAPDSPASSLLLPWIQVGSSSSGLSSLPVGIYIDNLTATMLVMVCFIGLLIQIYSYSYISIEVHHFGNQGPTSVSRFFACLNLFLFSMLGLVLAASTVQIYIFWELVGLCSYLLIGFWYFKSSAAAASKKAFVVTKFADLGFLLGVLGLAMLAGSFAYTDLLTLGEGQVNSGLLAVALALLFCGAIGKSAQFPLHIWLPDAMEGPTPVSALIHAATMVAAGVYLVARFSPLYVLAPEAATFVAWTGAVTALVAASIALVQNDIKKILAYSTVSQLGFMLTALGAGALTAGVFHLITHAFFKALLFLGSGAVIVACHSNDIWRMGGLSKKLPYTHFAFLMGSLALAGVFPWAGFWSKDEILAGLTSHPALLAVLAFTAFLTSFYVGRLYFVAFRGEFRGEHVPADVGGPVPSPTLPAPMEPSKDILHMQPFWTEQRVEDPHRYPPECLGALAEHIPHPEEGHEHVPHEVPALMFVPLLILSLFAIGLGFVGVPGEHNLFGHFVKPAVAEPEHGLNLPLMFSSGIIALLGLGLAGWLYARDPIAGERRFQAGLGPLLKPLQQKWYMDHIWAWLLSHFLYWDARVISTLDEKGVDGVVYGLGRFTYASGDMLRREQTGQLQRYAMTLTLGLLMLLFAAGVVEVAFLVARGGSP